MMPSVCGLPLGHKRNREALLVVRANRQSFERCEEIWLVTYKAPERVSSEVGLQRSNACSSNFKS